MIKNIKIDTNKLIKDLKQIEQKIIDGVIQGEKDAQEYMKNIMQFYIEETVYSVYNPKMYQRTYKLKNNVTAEVVGTSLYIFVNSDGMDLTQDGIPYPYRVLEGNDIYPYEHPVLGAAFMPGRDWRVMTKYEFLSHMEQSKQFKNIIINAINKKLRGK